MSTSRPGRLEPPCSCRASATCSCARVSVPLRTVTPSECLRFLRTSGLFRNFPHPATRVAAYAAYSLSRRPATRTSSKAECRTSGLSATQTREHPDHWPSVYSDTRHVGCSATRVVAYVERQTFRRSTVQQRDWLATQLGGPPRGQQSRRADSQQFRHPRSRPSGASDDQQRALLRTRLAGASVRT